MAYSGVTFIANFSLTTSFLRIIYQFYDIMTRKNQNYDIIKNRALFFILKWSSFKNQIWN